jgi:hypothetical protein
MEISGILVVLREKIMIAHANVGIKYKLNDTRKKWFNVGNKKKNQ